MGSSIWRGEGVYDSDKCFGTCWSGVHGEQQSLVPY